MEPLQRERWSGTTHLRWVPPDESFHTFAVVALDADGRVDAEAAGPLPGEHAVGVGIVEEASTPEVTKDATLDDVLEFLPVVGFEERGLMEANLPVRTLRERAVEYDTVVVDVCVER